VLSVAASLLGRDGQATAAARRPGPGQGQLIADRQNAPPEASERGVSGRATGAGLADADGESGHRRCVHPGYGNTAA